MKQVSTMLMHFTNKIIAFIFKTMSIVVKLFLSFLSGIRFHIIDILVHTKSLCNKPELLPKTSRHIVLQPGGSQMPKNNLQMSQNSNIVLLSIFSFSNYWFVIMVVVTENIISRINIAL